MADSDFLTFLPLFPGENETTIMDRMREAANEGLADDDENYVDTREGTFWWTCTMPMVRELARVYDFMGTEVPAASSPLWAWGDYLDDHAEVQDLARLEATFATGVVSFIGPEGTAVTVGTTVAVEPTSPDADAPEFQVTTGGTITVTLDPPDNLAATANATGGSLADDDYFYVVTAVNDYGETTISAEATDTVTGGGGNGSVDLTWDAVPDSTGYKVYRALVTGGPYGLIASPGTNLYTDDGSVSPGVAPPGANTTGGKVNLPVQAVESGSAGNVSAHAISVLLTPLTDVVVDNALPTAGGSDTETDEALRERLLDQFVGQGGGNVFDYKRWASAYPGVGRVTVIPLWDGPGTVLVIINDPNGDPTSAAIVDGLQEQLDPVPGEGKGLAPVGATVTVMTAALLAVTVTATVEFDSGFSLDGFGGTLALEDAIKQSVTTYVESVEPGGEVVLKQVEGRIVTVPGVHDVKDVEINGVAANLAVTGGGSPEVPAIDTIDLTEGTVP